MVELYVRQYFELKRICLAIPRNVDNGICGADINNTTIFCNLSRHIDSVLSGCPFYDDYYNTDYTKESHEMSLLEIA